MSNYDDTPLLEAETLDEMIDIMEDDIGDLIDAYVDDAPSLIADTLSGLAANDEELVVRSSHSLKSSSANLGIMRLSVIAKDIEETSRTGDLESCKPLASMAEALWPQCEAALREAIAKAG